MHMKNSALDICRKIAFTALLIISCISAFSQNNSDPGRMVSGLQSTIIQGDQAEVPYLTRLINSDKPTIAFIDNEMYDSDDDYQVVVSDIESYTLMLANVSIFSEVELLTIRIESVSDLDAALNIPDLNVLLKLKYVRLLVLYNICDNTSSLDACVKAKLAKHYQTFGAGNLNVFYSLSVPN